MVDKIDFTFTSKHVCAKKHANKIVSVIMTYPGFENMCLDPQSNIAVDEEHTGRAHVTMRLIGRDLLNNAALERAVERIKKDRRITRVHLAEALTAANEKEYGQIVFNVNADEAENYAKYLFDRLLSIEDFENYVVDKQVNFVDDVAQVRIILHQFGKSIDSNDSVKAALLFLRGQKEVTSPRGSRSRLSIPEADDEKQEVSKDEEELRKSSLTSKSIQVISSKHLVEEFEAKSQSESDRKSSQSAITPDESVKRKSSVLENKAISVKFQCNGDEVKLYTDILMKSLEKVNKFEENKYEQRVSIKGDNKAIIELIMAHFDNVIEDDPVDEVVSILKQENERVNDLAVESIVYVN